MSEIKMSGGLFFALLSEIRYTDENRSKRMGGVAEAVNNVNLFLNLASIAHNKYLKFGPVKKTVSAYKTCEGQGGLNFGSSKYIHELDSAVNSKYDATLARTRKFVDLCLRDTEAERLLCSKKIMFFVTYAVNIRADSVFIYNGKTLKKAQFCSLESYDFPALVLAVWHHIIKFIPNNKVGQETFNQYFEYNENKTEYFYKNEKLANLTQGLKVADAKKETTESDVSFFERDTSDEHIPLVNNDYYANYIENAVQRLSKIKTILYSKQPVDFYKIFVCNDIQKQKDYKDGEKSDEPLVSAYPKTLLDKFGHFIALTAPGGFGKSMFLKHLMLCDNRFADTPFVEPCGLVPVLLTLKDYKGNKSLEEFAFDKIKKFDNTLEFDVFKKDLNKGIFLFLFDALDEINRDLLDEFITAFSDFSDEYDSNAFVLSSRPNNICDSLTNFTSLSLLQFRQEQAQKLVNKFDDFPKEKRDEFNSKVHIHENFKIQFLKIHDRIRKDPYSTIEGNPLLLTIKFLVYIQTGSFLKNSAKDFYEMAYEVLYETHDQLHSQYNDREWETNLDSAKLKLAISEFCFLTYMQFKYSFTKSEIDSIVEEMKTAEKYGINSSAFIKDLKDNLTILFLEGGRYSFIHKSFQEYFVAFYLAKCKKASFDFNLISQIEFYHYSRIQTYLDEHEDLSGAKADEFFKLYDYEMYSVIDMFYQIDSKKAEECLFLPCLKKAMLKDPLGDSPEEMFYTYIQNAYWFIRTYSNGRSDANNTPLSDVIGYIIEEILKLSSLHDIEFDMEDGCYTRFYLYDAEGDGPFIPPDDLEQFEEPKYEMNPDGSKTLVEPEGMIYEISDFDKFIHADKDKFHDLKKLIKEEIGNEFKCLYEYSLKLQEKYPNKASD